MTRYLGKCSTGGTFFSSSPYIPGWIQLWNTDLHKRRARWRLAQHPSMLFVRRCAHITSYIPWTVNATLVSLFSSSCRCIVTLCIKPQRVLLLLSLLPPSAFSAERAAALRREKWVTSPWIASVTSRFVMLILNEWDALQAFISRTFVTFIVLHALPFSGVKSSTPPHAKGWLTNMLQSVLRNYN